MARIYDNIEIKFKEGLQGIMSSGGVERVDFCVGYFNLRGWNMIVNQVDAITSTEPSFRYPDQTLNETCHSCCVLQTEFRTSNV